MFSFFKTKLNALRKAKRKTVKNFHAPDDEK